MRKSFFILLIALTAANVVSAQLNTTTSKALLQRIVPGHAAQFAIEPLQSEDGKDVLKLKQRKIKLF